MYHAKEAVVFNRIQELVGHPGEVVNKVHLYDQMMESVEPSFARQTLVILVLFTDDEGSAERYPEGGTFERYPQASALSGSTPIAHRIVV